MTEHDRFDRLFAGVDGPVQPDPLFAARLRTQLVSRVAGEPNPAPLPVVSVLPAAPRPFRRHRWLDLAAAAVLLIGIISGLASLAPTGPATPRAIEAPDTSQPPVMSSGSAAQDGQIPGTIPEPGDAFNLLWEDDAVPDDVRYTSGGLIFGDSLFQMDGDGTTYELRARSLQTGEELWRAELSIDLSYAVTSRGVVMSRSEYGSQAFSVALLDRHTGAPIWQTDAIYEPSTNPLGTALVVNDTIFFVDRAMTMVALDLASGTERWRYDAAQGRSTAEMLGECTAASATCGRQAFRSSGFAIGRDALYLFAPVPDEVVALAITDGARAWVVDASERTGLEAPDVSLMATSQGLVVGASAPSSTVSVGTSQYLSLWSSDDGAEQWMQPIWTGYAVSMGSTLLISKVETSEMDDAVCCTLITIATATGETLGTTRLGDFRLAGYYPESDSVATFRLITQGGLEPSRIETWFILQFSTGPVELTQPIPDCATLTPSRDGRYLVCQRASGATAVYEPASVSATPAAVASPPPDVALQTRVAELEATIAALEPGQTATSFDQIDQGSAEVTITIDAQGLLEDDPAAEAAAIAAIREALAPSRSAVAGGAAGGDKPLPYQRPRGPWHNFG